MENKQKERTNERKRTMKQRGKKRQAPARTDTKRRLLSIIIGRNMRFTFVYDVGRCAWHQFLRLHFHTIFLTQSRSVSRTPCHTTYRIYVYHQITFRACSFPCVCMTFNYLFFSLTLLFIMCTLKTKHNVVCTHILCDIVELKHTHTYKSNKSSA